MSEVKLENIPDPESVKAPPVNEDVKTQLRGTQKVRNQGRHQ